MSKRRAFEQVEISHGGNTLTLRPSLRAATILEEKFGLSAVYKAVDDLNLTIISEIIMVTATSGHDAAAFLSSNLGRPLFPFFLSVRVSLGELVAMLTPPANKVSQPSQSTGKQMTWEQVFAALFERATGWLGWTPEQAWSATPTEIDRAYGAYVAKLKAIHGGGSEKERDPDPEQAERNITDGLDPEFDRDGLHALRGMGGAI